MPVPEGIHGALRHQCAVPITFWLNITYAITDGYFFCKSSKMPFVRALGSGVRTVSSSRTQGHPQQSTIRRFLRLLNDEQYVRRSGCLSARSVQWADYYVIIWRGGVIALTCTRFLAAAKAGLCKQVGCKTCSSILLIKPRWS